MNEENEKPPVFTAWRHWYAVVILILALVIVSLYVFSKAYQ